MVATMLQLATIYTTGLILLFYSMDGSYTGNYRLPSPLIRGQVAQIKKVWSNPELADMLAAYAGGYRRGLNRKTRQLHQHLYIAHLFTPSGIHLSAMLWGVLLLIRLLLTPLKKVKSRLGEILRPVVVVVISVVAIFWLDGYYSIKRISALRTVGLLRWNGQRLITLMGGFYLVFLFDFLFGSYRSSPLSLTYSFIFLGAILASIRFSGLATSLALLGGQLIIGFVTGIPLNPIAFFLGLALTALFSLLFPLLLLIFWGVDYLPVAYFEWVVGWWYYGIEVVAGIGKWGMEIEATLFWVMGMILGLALPRDWRWQRWLMFSVLLLVNSTSILNLPHDQFWMKKGQRVEVPISREGMKKSSRKSDGYQVHYRNGLKCRYRLGNSFYKRRCYRR